MVCYCDFGLPILQDAYGYTDKNSKSAFFCPNMAVTWVYQVFPSPADCRIAIAGNPRLHNEAAKRAFSYRGVVMWNGLGNKLKDETNLNSFKSALTLS